MGYWKSHHITVLIGVSLLYLAVVVDQPQGQVVILIACCYLLLSLITNFGKSLRHGSGAPGRHRSGLTLRLVKQLDAALNGVLETSTHQSRIKKLKPEEKFSLLIGQMEQIIQILTETRFNAASAGLLAANTAIEAARAGIQGKGIALVADEVKQLSISLMHFNDELQGFISRIRKVIDDPAYSGNAGINRDAIVQPAVMPETGVTLILLQDFDSYLRETLAWIAALNSGLSDRIEEIGSHLHAEKFFKVLSESNDKEMGDYCRYFSRMKDEITRQSAALSNSDFISKSHDFLDRIITNRGHRLILNEC